MRPVIDRRLAGLGALFFSAFAGAGGVPGVALDEVVITAKRAELSGAVQSASQGTVTPLQLEMRPVLRTGELLETVPGLVVTQHSGDGKANQYFLRGFNLDHGTDFATRVDGVPVNMPTHAHGQGYTDINFVIPELIDSIEYRKGTYYADEGNFSAAGAADLRYKRRIGRDEAGGGLFVAEGGENDFGRAVAAIAPRIDGGDLLIASEYTRNDGPWLLDEQLRKVNAVVKYSRGDRADGFSITLAGYAGKWRIYGGRAGVTRAFQIGSREARLRFGTEVRRDDIGTVGLYRTVQRERIGTIRADGSVRSSPTKVVNADVGYRFANGWSASLTGLNLFNSRDNDITYFYESQLHGEAEPVADRHFHPAEPRTFRVTLKARW